MLAIRSCNARPAGSLSAKVTLTAGKAKEHTYVDQVRPGRVTFKFIRVTATCASCHGNNFTAVRRTTRPGPGLPPVRSDTTLSPSKRFPGLA